MINTDPTECRTVTFTSSNPAKIFCTLDKSTPTAESDKEPIMIEETGTVVTAIAVADGKAPNQPVESKLSMLRGIVSFIMVVLRFMLLGCLASIIVEWPWQSHFKFDDDSLWGGSPQLFIMGWLSLSFFMGVLSLCCVSI